MGGGGAKPICVIHATIVAIILFIKVLLATYQIFWGDRRDEKPILHLFFGRWFEVLASERERERERRFFEAS